MVLQEKKGWGTNKFSSTIKEVKVGWSWLIVEDKCGDIDKNLRHACKKHLSNNWHSLQTLKSCTQTCERTARRTLHLSLKREVWMSNPQGASQAAMMVLSALDFKGVKEGQAHPLWEESGLQLRGSQRQTDSFLQATEEQRGLGT